MAAAENHKGFPWLAGGVCCRRWVPSPALQLPQQPDAGRASLTVVPGSHPARPAGGGQAPPSPTSPQECPNPGAHRGAEGRVRASMLHWLSTLMGGLVIKDQDPVLQTRTLRQSQAREESEWGSRQQSRSRKTSRAAGGVRLGSVWAGRGWRGAPKSGTAWRPRPCSTRRLALFLSGRAVPVHTHIWGSLHPSRPGVRSPPIQPATKSSSWKLPMAPAAAPRFPVAGSVPIQCLLDRACGQARQTGEVRDTDSLQAGPPPHRAAPLPAWGARGRLTSRPQWTLKAQSAGRRGSIHLQLFTSLRHWK